MDFKKELENRVEKANAAIEKWLPAQEMFPKELTEAMRYAVLAGGKRIRPVMMAECFGMFGGEGDHIEPFQAAIEFIHTSSLVHDDLPALDNDELRRGKATTHARFGEAQGILAGDALINYAYETVMEGIMRSPDIEYAVKAGRILSIKSGYRGMLGGQFADVDSDKKGIQGDVLQTLGFIYEQKTGELFEASMMAGAALAGAGEEDLKKLEEAGRLIGLAFQIKDDILDVSSSTEKLGKPVYSDIKNEKETYVSLFGVERAAETVKRYTDEALGIIKALSGDSEFLRGLFEYMAKREK